MIFIFLFYLTLISLGIVFDNVLWILGDTILCEFITWDWKRQLKFIWNERICHVLSNWRDLLSIFFGVIIMFFIPLTRLFIFLNLMFVLSFNFVLWYWKSKEAYKFYLVLINPIDWVSCLLMSDLLFFVVSLL